MLLEGSCYCGAVRFSVDSHTPYPYMRCYCSICRKTAGGGGYAINIMAEADTLVVHGRKNLRMFHAMIDDEKHPGERIKSPGQRHFCSACGSAMWVYDPRWPKLIYPFASAIDTPLPVPPERNHVMLDFRAAWVPVPRGARDRRFAHWPDETIVDWHRGRGLLVK
jgi:hypothetical protein